MRLRTLAIQLGQRPAGLLFQYGEGDTAITRFIPRADFWQDPQAPVLSWATVTAPAERAAFWGGSATLPFFNGAGTRLPAFFQNLLPEGALRQHLAQLRGCAADDHFELLATCGTDLPGAVYARPVTLDREQVAAIVTQHHDALEMSVVADPMREGTSLSGVQPKLSLVQAGSRYVARTRDTRGIHIIAKLPSAAFPLLPEVEALSLQLAQAAGVDVNRARLASLDEIDIDIPFVLGSSQHFLAVERFDRQDGQAHVHAEDFAQILGIPPEMKYRHPLASYGFMARVMSRSMGLGDATIEEFIRRLAVNELLGNYDAHVKNFGIIYKDGRTPSLSPAYDVVAYAAFLPGRGHALPFARQGGHAPRLSPAVIREFCNEAVFSETKAVAVVREVVRAACEQWPALIEASALLPQQKQRLLSHFEGVPMVASMRRRAARHASMKKPLEDGFSS